MARAQTFVKSETKLVTNVAVGVAIIGVAAIIATFGPRLVGNFAATTVKPGCIDSDGVDYSIKGNARDTGFTLEDSCKDTKVLNEAVCDPIRKYVNAVVHTCINGCNAGKCNPIVLPSSAPIVTITRNDFYIPITSADGEIKAWYDFTITAQSQDVYIAKRTTSTFEYLVNKNNSVVWQTPIAGINQATIDYTIDKAGTSTPGFLKIPKGQTLTGRSQFRLAQKKLDGSMLPGGFYSVSLKSLSYRNSATATTVQKVELIDTSKATTKSQSYPSLSKPVYQE